MHPSCTLLSSWEMRDGIRQGYGGYNSERRALIPTRGIDNGKTSMKNGSIACHALASKLGRGNGRTTGDHEHRTSHPMPLAISCQSQTRAHSPRSIQRQTSSSNSATLSAFLMPV